MLRPVTFALALVAASVPLTATRAGAQAYEVGWWLKANGSAQIVAEANHLWAEAYDGYGNHQGRAFDYWLDTYCQLQSVASGDNQGTPLRLRFASNTPGRACLPNSDGAATWWNQFYGWHDAAGTYSGQNFYAAHLVAEHPIHVFPRDAATVESRATLVEIY